MRSTLLIGLLCAGCGTAYSDAPPPSADASATDAPAADAGTAATPRDAGVRADDWPRDAGAPNVVVGSRDLGTVARHGHSQRVAGRSYWIEGNQVWVTDDPDASDGITGFAPAGGAAFELLPRDPPGCTGFFGNSPYATGQWLSLAGGALVPLDKTCVEDGRSVLRGSGVARWPSPNRPLPLSAVRSHPRDPELMREGSDPVRPMSLLSATTEGVAYVYAYDCGRQDGWQYVCRLSRAPEREALLPGAWRDWDGLGWAAPGSTAAEVMRADSGRINVSYDAYLGRYVAIYGAWSADAVRVRFARSPEGPWSEAELAFSPQAPDTRSLYSLDVRLHPEFEVDRGRRVYVTYRTRIPSGADETRLVEVSFERP